MSLIALRILLPPSLGLLLVSQLLGQQADPFQGSVPSGGVSATPLALTLDDAIQRGLKFNLGLLQNDVASQTARAERILALSSLLPQVTGQVTENEEQLNLKTLGINIPPNPVFNIPTRVAPFSYTQAQANVSAKILDWTARRNFKSAKSTEEAARLSVQDARDLVTQAVASAYLLVISDDSRLESIQAQAGQDIFVACDSSASLLLMNNRDGTFHLERGAALSDDGVEQAGMGFGIGDFNLDGHLDLFTAHFTDDTNGLCQNDGKGNFNDVTLVSGLGLETRFTGWGAGIVDLDNDGYPGLFLVTGNVYPELERN